MFLVGKKKSFAAPSMLVYVSKEKSITGNWITINYMRNDRSTIKYTSARAQWATP